MRGLVRLLVRPLVCKSVRGDQVEKWKNEFIRYFFRMFVCGGFGVDEGWMHCIAFH